MSAEAPNKYIEYTPPPVAQEADGGPGSPGAASVPSPAPPPDCATLDALVEQFVSAVERRFPQRLKTRPKALKRRVQYLIRVKLPPRPRPTGRPPRVHITRALDLYREQRREVEQGTRAEVNWAPIARECLPGFAQIRSEWKRCLELTKLRNAVYARERRLHGAHKRRRRSSRQNAVVYGRVQSGTYKRPGRSSHQKRATTYLTTHPPELASKVHTFCVQPPGHAPIADGDVGRLRKTAPARSVYSGSSGLGSYKPAWTWLHKLGRAMMRPGRDRLRGCMGVDETVMWAGWGEALVRNETSSE